MAARLRSGVPAVRYASKGVIHTAVATGYGNSITGCDRIAYGMPWEAKPEDITCKKCMKRL